MALIVERRVIKGFIDKNTKKKHPKGAKYSSDDIERVNELVQKGFLSGEKVTEHKQKKKNDLEEKSMTELKEIADEKGIEVTGTGKNGAIKKEDYIKALEA